MQVLPYRPQGAAALTIPWSSRVELGFEPPLDAGTRRHALDERRRVSVRWLSATVLTGCCSLGLMGLTVLGSLKNQSATLERPDFVAALPAKSQGAGGQLTSSRKGDKLIRSVDLISAKQVFKTPTIAKVGDREVIRNKSFARVAGPLVLASTVFRDEVPPFNPMQLMADGGSERSNEGPGEAADDSAADGSLVTRDIARFDARAINAAALNEDEARQQVIDLLSQPKRTGPALLNAPQSMLARTMRVPAAIEALSYASPTVAPFSGLEVRMVPENVTVAPKLDEPMTKPAPDEKLITVKKGETAETAMRNAGAAPQAAKAAINALVGTGKDRSIAEGQRLKLLFSAPPGTRAAKELVRVMLYSDETLEAITAINDKGVFVPVALPTVANTAAANDDDDDSSGENDGIRLFNSLYETALKNDMPKPVVQELVRIFSYDMDFQRRVAGGDAFDVLYTEEDDADIAKGEVLYAAINVGGETRRFFRFHTQDDGTIDYYDENGRSAKQFLLRKPITDAQLRSGFGYRRHPILGYSKPHTGVDWANRVGTPILAAGNGTVIKAEWDTGYGRRTEIQHVNGYVTTYSHQSSFARGIQPGAKVRQGQVIGYIGTTGLSTGPHLHYELIVNDQFVDPMRIKLPKGRELEGRMLAEFKRERQRIEGLLEKSPNGTQVATK